MVRVSGQSHTLTQQITAGEKNEFNFIADEPVKLGGDNKGPTPYDLILSALGSCMSMTMFMYTRRKKWPLESVEIELDHNRIHAKDCEACETKSGMLDEIHVKIKLNGALSIEQREKIFSIAKRCPVHNTLTKEVVLRSSLEKAHNLEPLSAGVNLQSL